MGKPREKKRSSAGAKVTVACKLPNGLKLRLFEAQEISEPQRDGTSKTIKLWLPTEETVTVNGNAVPVGVTAEHPIVAGYGLTHGVDKEFFETWLAQNKDSVIVKRGLIFAYEKEDRVRGEAKDRKDVRSGLEPVAQDGDYRMPQELKADKKAA